MISESPPLLLLLFHLVAPFFSLPVDGGASPLLTFEDNDPLTGTRVRCDRCPPGTYLLQRCSSTRKSECARCPPGSFTKLWNHIDGCLRCSVCGHNQHVKAACTAESNCQCECNEGYYYHTDQMCVRHRRCATGHGAESPGSPSSDTVCRSCSKGTFSNMVSAHQNCTGHRPCGADQLRLLQGSRWHDNVCGNCGEVKGVAIYLKQIVPAVLVPQQGAHRRLRRVVLQLTFADGTRPKGVSKMDLDGLHRLIDQWVESASDKQIRALPAVLTQTGMRSAANRLEEKLQLLDTAIEQHCGLGNEV